jgi:hypothetical protein
MSTHSEGNARTVSQIWPGPLISSCHSVLQKISLNKKISTSVYPREHLAPYVDVWRRIQLHITSALEGDQCSRVRLSLYPQAFEAKWRIKTISVISNWNYTSISAVVQLNMEVEQRWKDVGGVISKHSDRNLFHCPLVDHASIWTGLKLKE